jgi:hypothetical protein
MNMNYPTESHSPILSQKMYINTMGWRKFYLLNYIDKKAEEATGVTVEFTYWENIDQIKATLTAKNLFQDFFFNLKDKPFEFELVFQGNTSGILFNPLQDGLREKLKLLLGDVEENQFVGDDYELCE